MNTNHNLESADLRPAGLHIAPILAIHLVHLGKVVHVGQEHVHLDDIVDGAPGGIEDSGQVLDTLVLIMTKKKKVDPR